MKFVEHRRDPSALLGTGAGATQVRREKTMGGVGITLYLFCKSLLEVGAES
jgi:hypothetical protein